MQSSVQYKDISQENNNSHQCTRKNIIFIFYENVVHCIDTTCKIETKLDFGIVMYCKLPLICPISSIKPPVLGPSTSKQTKKTINYNAPINVNPVGGGECGQGEGI